MTTKLIGYILSGTSIGFSLMFIAMNAVHASEVPDLSASAAPKLTNITQNTAQNATQNIAQNATQLSLESIEPSQAEIARTILADQAEDTAPLFQNWTDVVTTVATIETDPIARLSPVAELNSELDLAATPIESIEPDPLFSTFSASELAQLATKEQEFNNFAFLYGRTAVRPNESPNFSPYLILDPEHWQTSQISAELAPDASESTSESTSETRESASTPWRFTFAPYAFVPLTTTGSATVRDFTADIDLGLDDILDPLNFALAGRFEGWHGNLGFIFDSAYFNVGQDSSASFNCPSCFEGILPSEIDTEVNVQYGQFDLGVGYRIAGVNPATAATDFDLGPLILDTIVGVRLYAISQEIDLSTNLGTDRNLNNSNVLIQPLVSSRLRWNVSPKLAGWVRGDVAGFGIGGTLMAFSVTGGVDWMFSGNTSLLLAYRLSSLEYNTEVDGQDFDLDLLFQGPYMGVVFRF